MQSERILSRFFIETHPEDAAQILERFSAEDLAPIFEDIEPDTAAEVLQRMASAGAANCLASLPPHKARSVIETLALESAVALLRQMDSNAQALLLDALSPETTAQFRLLLQYPEDTAGSLMDPRAASLPEDITVEHALRLLRQEPDRLLSYIYILDRTHTLVGVTTLREIITSNPKKMLRSLMNSPVVSVPASADRTVIMNHPGWQKFHKLPVIGGDGLFLGAIHYKTFRRLELRPVRPHWGRTTIEVTLMVGELYYSAVSELLQSLIAIGQAPSKSGTTAKEVHDDASNHSG